MSMLKFTDARTDKSVYLDFDEVRNPRAVHPQKLGVVEGTLLVTHKRVEYLLKETSDEIMNIIAEAEAKALQEAE